MANKTFFIANQHSFATSKCLFGTDSISSGSKEDTLLCDILCSVRRTRCFVTKTPCPVGKALLSGTEKLSPLFVEVQQVEDGSVFLDGAFSFRSTFLVARWLQGSVSPKSGALFHRGSYCSGGLSCERIRNQGELVSSSCLPIHSHLHKPPLQFFGSLVGFPVSLRSDL